MAGIQKFGDETAADIPRSTGDQNLDSHVGIVGVAYRAVWAGAKLR